MKTAMQKNAESYAGKTVVVKYGGKAMTSPDLKKMVMEDLIALKSMGIRVILVHGGGPELTDLLKKTGKESRFVNGLRYTDEETMDAALMVLSGKINKQLAALLGSQGCPAVGLCGIDGGLMRAQKLQSEADLGLVGEVVSVNTGLLDVLIDSGYMPVISTGADDGCGTIYNINADPAASAVAVGVGAEVLLLMTDTPGLLLDKSDESTLVEEATLSELDTYSARGIIDGGMIPKVECCVNAVKGGVKKAVILDGRKPHAILGCLIRGEKMGTTVTMEAE
jgi:acetylglutamate kinase